MVEPIHLQTSPPQSARPYTHLRTDLRSPPFLYSLLSANISVCLSPSVLTFTNPRLSLHSSLSTFTSNHIRPSVHPGPLAPSFITVHRPVSNYRPPLPKFTSVWLTLHSLPSIRTYIHLRPTVPISNSIRLPYVRFCPSSPTFPSASIFVFFREVAT